jgi:hypothetical protein
MLGYCSMRNPVHYTAEETEYGPFYVKEGQDWYMQTYYGFDVVFTADSVRAAT